MNKFQILMIVIGNFGFFGTINGIRSGDQSIIAFGVACLVGFGFLITIRLMMPGLFLTKTTNEKPNNREVKE